jgi:hypothetical protein
VGACIGRRGKLAAGDSWASSLPRSAELAMAGGG